MQNVPIEAILAGIPAALEEFKLLKQRIRTLENRLQSLEEWAREVSTESEEEEEPKGPLETMLEGLAQSFVENKIAEFSGKKITHFAPDLNKLS